MANNIRECEQRNKALKEEKEAIQAHFQNLKAKMNKFRERNGKQLTELTQNSSNAIKQLQFKLKKVTCTTTLYLLIVPKG
jgi:hypothetical protein